LPRRPSPGTPLGLLLDSLYGAVVIRLMLSPQDQRAALAEHPMSYAAPIDFVLDGLLDSRQALRANSGADRDPARVARGLARPGVPRPARVSLVESFLDLCPRGVVAVSSGW
jgi:hypothetical protein